MPRKVKPMPKHADPSEFERFVETAIAVGADKDGKALDRAIRGIASRVQAPKPNRA